MTNRSSGQSMVAPHAVERPSITGGATVIDVVVVGAGQAGLSASFHLRRLGVEHVVLDANEGPGGAWRHRWPSSP